jgi:IclR family transcriptional regulator, acetate operon repressor
MPTAHQTKKKSTPRLSKATGVVFAVLGELDQQKDGASLTRLAKRLHIDDETLRPYLNRMIELRKIYQDEIDDRYYLDPDGPPTRPTQADPEAIRRILEQFTADTKRDVALAVLYNEGLRLPVYVKPLDGPALLANLRPDSAHGTAAGHALLSERTNSYVRRYFARFGMPRFTDATPTTLEALRPHLTSDARGIWSARGQYCTDGACIAVLAHDSKFRDTRFALTTSVKSERYLLDRDWLRDRLLQCSGELQTVLGPLDA